MKKLFLNFLLLVLSFSVPREVLASFSKSEVETKVEGGSSQIYQSVETTVDGQTVKKESTQPGKLELEMEKIGESEPTITFSQETQEELTPPKDEVSSSPSFIVSMIDFFRKLFLHLTPSNLTVRFFSTIRTRLTERF